MVSGGVDLEAAQVLPMPWSNGERKECVYGDDDLTTLSLFDAVYLFAISCLGVAMGYVASMWTWPDNLVPFIVLILALYLLSTHPTQTYNLTAHSSRRDEESRRYLAPPFAYTAAYLTEKSPLLAASLTWASSTSFTSPGTQATAYTTPVFLSPHTATPEGRHQLQRILQQERQGCLAGVYAFGGACEGEHVWVVVEDMDRKWCEGAFGGNRRV